MERLSRGETTISTTDAAHPRFVMDPAEIVHEPLPSSGLRIAFVQMLVGSDKTVNLNRALEYVRNAKTNGAHLVALPECFNSPYGTAYFKEYAENIPDGTTSKALSNMAKENKVCIVGGSIPELSDGKYFNTCTVWGEDGQLLAKHRKVHLFDIDIPGKITFKESDVLTGGSNLNTFQLGAFKIGLGICYDLRFDEMARIYAKMGCHMILYPGAFNMTTGPLHWELLARARANDTQMYIGVISPARDTGKNYIAWGHSTLADPWGKVIAKAGSDEEILIAEIDMSTVEEVRSQIPTSKQRRSDIYDTVSKSNL